MTLLNKYSIRRHWISAADLGTTLPWIPEPKEDVHIWAHFYKHDPNTGITTFYYTEEDKTNSQVLSMQTSDIGFITWLKSK